MANLALQLRLGIRRGWRVKMFNDLGLYTSSLLHCLFVFVVIRAKSLRLNIWVVGHYLFKFQKKLIIFVFFWFLPLRAIHKVVSNNLPVRLRVGLTAGGLFLQESSRLLVSVVPVYSNWLRARHLNHAAAAAGRRLVSFSKFWDLGGSLLRFFVARSKYIDPEAGFCAPDAAQLPPIRA